MDEITRAAAVRHRAEVRRVVDENAGLDIAHTAMNILATVIATYGLLAGSTAVVIGAMIVAMLLNPILGFSMGLAESDHKLILRAGRGLLGGTVAVFTTAFLIGYLHRDIPITAEILARTSPSLLDLMIALAGGAAGAYATVSPQLSIAFVGVAIATALVPPLSSAAILLARHETGLAWGALTLAATNIIAIQFSASVVMWVIGFRGISRLSKSLPAFLARDAPSIVIVMLLGGSFAANLEAAVSRELFETRVRGVVRAHLEESTGAHLVEVRFDNTTSDHVIIRAVLRAPEAPTAEAVAALEDELPAAPGGERLELRVRYVNTRIIGRDGPLFDPLAGAGTS